MRLHNKVAIITGGASGIGKESCIAFVKEGAKVVIADLNVEEGEKLALALHSAGGDTIFIRTDVTDEESVQNMVAEVKRHYGRIDILFNNTTWNKVTPIVELSLGDWTRIMETTLTGPFLCCKYVIKEMLQNGGGSIINTASVGGSVAFKAHPAYNAAKGGVIMLTKNIALDYGSQQIRANCISPGIIETPMTLKDLSNPEIYENLISKCFTRRIGQPIDIANAAIFLASDESSFITGTDLLVDNGWTAV